MRPLPSAAAVVLALAALAVPASGTATAASAAPAGAGQVQKFTLYNGSKVEIGPDGIGWITDASGRNRRPFTAVSPQAGTVLGDRPGPNRDELIKELSTNQHGLTVPGTVIVALSSGVVDGAALPSVPGHRLRVAHTTDARVNTALRAVGADTAENLFSGLAATRIDRLSAAAASRLGTGALDLSRLYLVHVTGTGAVPAAARLRATPGVAYAQPDFYLSPMDTSAVRLPASTVAAADRLAATTANAGGATTATAGGTTAAGSGAAATATAGGTTAAGTGGYSPDPALPGNFGLASSYQSYLNSSGVDYSGAYADIVHRFGQIPGQGENITNVSLGDLTDQAMADAGDGYVSWFGPTTIVSNGQRYLDYPSLPLIPTFTADMNANLDPLGTVEKVDPYLGEVLLDFSVMAPLPHDQQRPGEVGSGPTDLLGLAPGANYRLVEPAQPTFANILTAIIAAAGQTPRPDVITASLGFGADVTGFAGRYLEDDPVIESVIAGIVTGDGIVVTLSANDGTRIFTPAPIGPDGGATPTDVLTAGQSPTSVADDALSTAPSVVPDSGAIAVGGTTLDDTIAVPPQDGGPLAHTGTFAETRLDGATSFASGFGTRVDVSAPSDNIAAINHTCCTADSVVPVLSGGTSASAPMTAAAAADLLQVARLTGHPIGPTQVRSVLEQTGRAVPTQPQVDRDLHVGPQIDLTRAVESLLESGPASIVRLSVAHRSDIGRAGAEFTEMADPTNIDLTGPLDGTGTPSGENLVGPVTIGLDVTGAPRTGVSYALVIGSRTYTSATPSIRLLPAEILAAAGLPLVSTADRNVPVTVQLRHNAQVLAQVSRTLTFGPTDGTHELAPAPVVDPVVAPGTAVTVHYDLSGIPATNSTGTVLLDNPELLVSAINHWSPLVAPLFRAAYTVPLTATAGTVTIPASVFAGGAGVYGVTVEQNSAELFVGATAAFRVGTTGISTRPAAPTIAAAGGTPGHQAVVTRAAPSFVLHWDASTVSGATGAIMEVSAPGPSLYGLYNTFTNQFGDGRDDDGVDSGSTWFGALPAVSGTATFDPAALHLPSSMRYSVRVFASAGGAPIGQASPSAGLEYDDGFTPGDATIDDFDVPTGGGATVTTSTQDASGRTTGSAIYRYDTSTGTYGASYARDDTGTGNYFLYGSDPANHRLLAVEYPRNGSTQHLLTYDTSTGAQVNDVPIDGFTGYNMWAGRVDPLRHRAAILAWRGGDNADVVLPVDTTSGTIGTPVLADNQTTSRSYNMLDIDVSTGDIDLAGAPINDFCLLGTTNFTTVNLDTAHAAPNKTLTDCGTGLASDQAGHAEVTIGPLYAFPMLPIAQLQQVKERAGVAGPLQQLGPDSPLFPVVDPVHKLLLVAFLAGADHQVNNNAMSEVGVYNLATGARIELEQSFSFMQTAEFGPAASLAVISGDRGIQLNPATRTGWTYGPGGTQLQQFSY